MSYTASLLYNYIMNIDLHIVENNVGHGTYLLQTSKTVLQFGSLLGELQDLQKKINIENKTFHFIKAQIF